MFSGIVEEIGTVRELGSSHLTIDSRTILSDTRISDSISVSGVCLTVSDIGENWFRADVMPETLRRSNLGRLSPGDRVNLERAVTPTTRLGGHFVLGHVDGVGRIAALVPEDRAIVVSIQAPVAVMRYIALKGSIAIDGVSLTVAGLEQDSFSVSLVAYTSGQTTLGTARLGQVVNLEVDVLARYIERLQQSVEGDTGVTWELLRGLGY